MAAASASSRIVSSSRLGTVQYPDSNHVRRLWFSLVEKFLIMSNENLTGENLTGKNKTPDTSSEERSEERSENGEYENREYEKSGLYPNGEKPFRLFALLGFLAGVIVFIAVSAAVLDRLLI